MDPNARRHDGHSRSYTDPEGVLQFDVIISDQRIVGRRLPYTALRDNDIFRVEDVSETLGRLLGVDVRIVTSGEE